MILAQRRSLTAPPLVLLASVLFAAGGRAQVGLDEGDAPDDTTGAAAADTSAARSDTTATGAGVPRGLDALTPPTLGFHPAYTTSFDVFKSKRDWAQSLSLNQQRGPASLNSSIKSTITRDENQNDLEFFSSGIANRLSFSVAGELNAGLIANFDRSKRLSRTSDLRSTTDLLRFTSGYRRMLADSLLLMNVDGQAGVRSSETRSFLRSGVTGSRDRTLQDGPSLQFSGALTNEQAPSAPPVTFRLDVTADAFRQETDQRNETLAGDFTTVTAERDSTFRATNTNRSATATFGWRPASALDVSVDLNQRVSRQVRPQPRQAKLENTDGDDRRGSVTAVFDPGGSLEFSLRAETSTSDRSSNLATSSNRMQTISELEATMDYEFLGIDIEAALERSTDETDYQPIESGSVQIDQSSRALQAELKLKRELGPMLTANVAFDIALDQKFFDDGILDVDRQDRTTDLAITYRPVSRFTGRLSFTEDRQRTVNLHASRAGNTNTQQRVTVGAGYTFTVLAIRLAQNLSINAQSRTFDFADEDQSDLARNNRLQTTLAADLTENVTLDLEHVYNFRNSGRFARDELGERRFTLNREFIEQRLGAGVAYQPAPWLTFSSDQALRAVVNRSPGEEGTRTTQYELELLGSLSKLLMEAVKADLTVKRVLSTREEFYWQVKMTASRTF